MIAYIIIPNCEINYIRFLEIFNVERMKRKKKGKFTRRSKRMEEGDV